MKTAWGEITMEPQEETGMMHRNIKGCWPPQKLWRGKEGFYPESQRKDSLLTSWFWISTLQNSDRRNFSYFKPPSCGT